ncbi:MAG: endonuclease/exonuclease/phosphatase family protein [Acidimicrobiia bacterium]
MFVIAAAGMVLAVVSIAAFFGEFWWPLDLLANFRPQFGVALAGAAALLGLGRWRRSAGVVAVAAVVNLGLVGWLWVPSSVEAPASADPMRVLSFNVLAANENYGEVMAYVAEVDADLVFLHESSLPWEEAADGADLGYRVVKTRNENHIFGTLVLVKGEARVESFGFTTREPRSVEVIYALDSGKEVAVLGVHPVAPVGERDSGLRDAQMAFAANWVSEQTLPTVIAGDFNASPWSHAFRRLLNRGDLRDSQRGFGLQQSFPASSSLVFRIAIDHVLVSDHIEVVERHLDDPLGSDHFPVVVDLLVG